MNNLQVKVTGGQQVCLNSDGFSADRMYQLSYDNRSKRKNNQYPKTGKVTKRLKKIIKQQAEHGYYEASYRFPDRYVRKQSIDVNAVESYFENVGFQVSRMRENNGTTYGFHVRWDGPKWTYTREL